MSVYLRLSPIAFVVRYGYRVSVGWLGSGVVLVVAACLVISRPGWRTVMAVFALLALIGGIHELRRARRGAIAVAIDYPGIYFGEALNLLPDNMTVWIKWADIAAVECLEGSLRVVEVLPDGTHRTVTRRMEGWKTDAQSIRAAVARFAPQIPVLPLD